jgi:heterodisulfide reductase subunit A
MQASLDLAGNGIHSILIERENELGGLALKLSPGALEGVENELPKIDDVMNNENIEVMLGCEIKNIEGGVGHYRATIQTQETEDNEKEITVGGILIATGTKIFDPTRIPELKYQYDDVITSLDLEKMIAAKAVKCPSNDSVPKRINFIQCVGSRDEVKGNPHCSLVCCTYAIRQAMQIKELNPESAIYIHYMDLRGPYNGFEELYRDAQEMGIQFIRGRIADVQMIDDKLALRAENIELDDPFEWESDLIVLSVGQEASEGTDKLSEMLFVPLDIDGFLGEYNYRWDLIDRRGISVAGGAQGPRNVKHAIMDAKRSATELAALFQNAAIKIVTHSYIDPTRCKGCGICEGLCPYNAITLKNLEDFETEEIRKISEVDAAICQGCGACTMSCPSGVPFLLHFTDDQILAEIEAII